MATTPAYLPANPKVTSCLNCRGPEQYAAVLAQFDVLLNERYHAREGLTFCNIFVWDVTRAMSCEIPHWWLSHELNANAVYDWLRVSGPAYGWQPCTADEAAASASKGEPAVVVWKNMTGKSGHIAVVVPTPAGAEGVHIAQAGATNFPLGAVGHGFGNRPVRYWRHD